MKVAAGPELPCLPALTSMVSPDSVQPLNGYPDEISCPYKSKLIVAPENSTSLSCSDASISFSFLEICWPVTGSIGGVNVFWSSESTDDLVS
jgi:hypothetical protein